MKRHFFPTLWLLALAGCLYSCGSNENNATANPDSSSTPKPPATPPPPGTIVNTPQDVMVFIHEVADFNKWKAAYESHDTARVARGLHNYVIGRSVEDSNRVIVAVKVDDLQKAKAFAADPKLAEVMKKGGVTSKPDVMYMTMVWQDTSQVATDIRSRTSFTVKDFDAWRKSFESHRQTRIDNGLTDRVYGHDPTDPTKVTLVVAVLDTAKANAFWNSDLLKQQRAEGGVISKPDRFVYRIAKRY